MNKTCFVIILVALFLGQIKAQTNDPVIMKIAGENILRSEFEYTFNKNNVEGKINDKRAIEEYVDLFINYKLKVKAALDNKFDTLSTFKDEFEQYRDAQLKSYLIDTMYIDSVARASYDNIKKSVGDSDILLVSHIMIAIPQKANDDVISKAKKKIDSLYQCVKAGEDFGELAKKYSEDKSSSSKGGLLPWLGPKSDLPDFTKKVYSMHPGEISSPFLSTAGYHIIKMHERKPLESYEERKPEIVRIWKSRGIESKAKEVGLRKLIQESNGSLDKEQVIDRLIEKASADNPDVKNLIREYRDGLLLYEAVNRLVWQPAAMDVAGVEKFFKKNKKNYTWSSPRFKGFLIFSKRKVNLEKAVKIVKPFDNREDAVKALKKELGQGIMKQLVVKYGVFKEGDDARVDHKVFGKPAPKVNINLSYYDVVGSMKNAPEIYSDDKKRVTSDYQDMKEKEWVKSLRSKYSYSVNKNILATVNNH